MAVDLGNWYLTADKLQRAADAASLAGAPYLPTDLAGAKAQAEATLAANGVITSGASQNANEINQPVNAVSAPNPYKYTVYIHKDPKVAGRLDVEVGIKVRNYLLGLIGVNDEWLTRQANGQFRAAIQMGSPGDVLGAEPTSSAPGQGSVQDATLVGREKYMGKYWLNIAGGKTSKVYGDRYTAGTCSSANDDCQNGINQDVGVGTYGVREHQYRVHIPKTVVGPVTLQVFDAAAVDVGDYCTENSYLGFSAIQSVATAYGLPSNLYDAGAASQYCTGDNIEAQGAGGYGGDLPLLTLTVHDNNAEGKNLGTQLSQKQFPGVGLKENLVADLQSNTLLRQSFRQWYSVYTFNHPGDYIIEAQTPNNAIGANRFSLRLGVGLASGWDTTQAGDVSIAALHHLTVYTNAKSNLASFYFAKLPSNVAGRNIDLHLYDIGDAPYPVSLRLIPPRMSNITGFGSCVQQGPGTLPSITKLPCGVDNATTTNYNGKDVILHMTIPPNYSCNDNAADACWMALQFDLMAPPGVTVDQEQPSTDTTTWQIDDCGAPDRLVKPGSADINSCSVPS